MKEGLDDSKKFNNSKNKENNELRNEIEKLKEEKVKGSNIIDDLTKLYEAPSTVPKIIQDVRKRDDKAKTFALPDNDDKMKILAELTEAKIKTPDGLVKRSFTRIKKPEDLEMDKFFENINKYEDINLNDANNLIDEIKKNIRMGDNALDLGEDKFVYFNNINDFLHDIKNCNINNFNREEKYKENFEEIENKLVNRRKYSKFGKYVELYVKYLNNLKKILFTKKSSGRGLSISSLPILLSRIYTNNSSKELVNNIKQLVKNLCDNKQITEQVYNILINLLY